MIRYLGKISSEKKVYVCCIEPIQGAKPFPEFLRLSMHVLYSGSAQTLWNEFAMRSSCEHAIVHLEDLKKYGNTTKSKENKFYFLQERDVPLMWEPYSYKFHFFLCCSPVLYRAVNILWGSASAWHAAVIISVSYRWHLRKYFALIRSFSLSPPPPLSLFLMHLLEVVKEVGQLLFFLGCVWN